MTKTPVCFIAVSHTAKEVYLYTCLEKIGSLNAEIISKHNLPTHGWGSFDGEAEKLANSLGYKLDHYDQFYKEKNYPDYSNIEW